MSTDREQWVENLYFGKLKLCPYCGVIIDKTATITHLKSLEVSKCMHEDKTGIEILTIKHNE